VLAPSALASRDGQCRRSWGAGGFRGSNELHSDVASALAREAAVPELCAYGPCKCSIDADTMGAVTVS